MGLLRAIARAVRGHGPDLPGLPRDARVEADRAYGSDPAQRLDVYVPAVPSGSLIVVVHGGAWALGDKASVATVAAKVAHWLPAGHVVVSVNYRLLPRAGPLEQARDVACAIAHVQEHARSWGADPARVILLGHSTGAHLAALLAADADLCRAAHARPWLATLLLDSAALDVVHAMQAPHRPFFDRAFGPSEDDWRDASPLHRLRTRPAPILVVHSSLRPESEQQARRFAEAVAAVGGRVEVLPVALSHAEINVQLGEDGPYTARVDAFLASVTAPQPVAEPVAPT